VTAPLTPAHIRESNLIEGIDDPTDDAVGWVAWCWLTSLTEIRPHHVEYLHRVVTAHQWQNLAWRERGAWRTCQVWVGDREGAPSADLPALMAQWCVDLTLSLGGTALTPQAHHVAFEHIHPFVDGNGRVGRLLMWWHETCLGLQPTYLRATDRQSYYRWFQ
jgi:hypothetical protein